MNILFAIIAVPLFIVLFITLGLWVFAIIFGFLLIFFLAWACGVPITVTVNGQKMVYRRTTRIA